MSRRIRMLIGCIMLLVWIALYILLAATVGGLMVDSPIWASLLYYAAAGIAWILPLKPFLAWMARPDPDTQTG